MNGKQFAPKYPYGPKPEPSASFSYDHNRCRDWYDKWLSRGGTVARDSVYIERARDMPDLRPTEDRRRFIALEWKLRKQRSEIRLSALRAEIHGDLTNIVPFRERRRSHPEGAASKHQTHRE